MERVANYESERLRVGGVNLVFVHSVTQPASQSLDCTITIMHSRLCTLNPYSTLLNERSKFTSSNNEQKNIIASVTPSFPSICTAVSYHASIHPTTSQAIH